MNPLLDIFLAEAAELLGDVDAALLRLEREPDDLDLVNQVFRAAHTIKGSAGLFGFTELIRVTHAAEDLLDAVRSGDRGLDADLADGLLAAFDLVRRYLAAVTATGELPADAAVTSAEVIARLGGPAAAAAVAIEAAAGPAALARGPEWTVALGESYVRELAEWLATAAVCPEETEVVEVGAAGLLAALEPAAAGTGGPDQPTVDGTGVKAPDAVADAWFLLAGAMSALSAGSGRGQLMSVARSACTAADLLGLDTTDLAAAETAEQARDALRALLAQQMMAPTATYHPALEREHASPADHGFAAAVPPGVPAAPPRSTSDTDRVGSRSSRWTRRRWTGWSTWSAS
jgi:chemotaxis protein histidine kinase CheA